MKPLFLIGLPGCGKTTLGRALARDFGCEFFDLDLYIEQRFRSSVADMFATVGEEEFRRRESVMLREVGEMEDVVIACGGGTPCHSSNIDYMRERGTAVWLRASEEVLARRIALAGARRPMFASCAAQGRDAIIARLRALSAQREPFYSRAPYEFSSDELENRRLIEGSVRRFRQEIPVLAD